MGKGPFATHLQLLQHVVIELVDAGVPRAVRPHARQEGQPPLAEGDEGVGDPPVRRKRVGSQHTLHSYVYPLTHPTSVNTPHIHEQRQNKGPAQHC